MSNINKPEYKPKLKVSYGYEAETKELSERIRNREKVKHDSYNMHIRSNAIQELIGTQIRQVRLKKGISQMELSFECGVDQHYISKVESGKVNISVKSLYKILYYLDCHIKVLENEEIIPVELSPLMRAKNPDFEYKDKKLSEEEE